jgi:release factor glutamine methyltransferase
VINQFPKTLEMQVLLAHVTGRSRTWVLSHPELSLTSEQEKALVTASEQLEAGVPLPYIIGHWEFFGLDFDVTPEVLIPRPETELLIETALAWIRTRRQSAYHFIDIGTGSGIIPVTLAVHVPTAEILATDISPAALTIARQNAAKHGVQERIRFIEADLLTDAGQWTREGGATINAHWSTVDILTANLPYIPTATLRELDVFSKEPALALDGGLDGLELIRRLLDQVTARQLPVGLILLEIENRQGLAVRELAQDHFPDAEIQIKKDLAGHDRLAVIALVSS